MSPTATRPASRNSRRFAPTLGLAFALMGGVALSCHKDPPPPTPAEATVQAMQQAGERMKAASQQLATGAGRGPADMAEAMKAMGQALNGGKKVDPVDFRQLKALLPEEIGAFKRKDARGEKNAAMGFAISEASARFDGDAGANLHLKISDAGSLTGPLSMALASWAMVDVDRESDDEYEKSTTYGGFKAMEKYNNKSKSGTMSVLVGGRFIVEARGNDVKMDDIKAALAKVDLKKLDAMKTQGVQ